MRPGDLWARALCLRNLRRLPILGSNVACVLLCATLSNGGAPFVRGGRLLLQFFNLDEPEAVAERKGSIRRLLDEKWANAYKLASPRGLFTLHERRRGRRGPSTALGGGEGLIGPLFEINFIATCIQRDFNAH